jgi:hypothetical protein
MYRTLIGIAAIIAATGYLLRSLPDAQAQSLGPVISQGEAPWISLTGRVEGGDTEALYTVPSDQVFVLTGACLSDSDADIYEDSTLKVDSRSFAAYCDYAQNYSVAYVGMLGRNTSHIVFEADSVVSIEAQDGDAEYMLQGYLAHP